MHLAPQLLCCLTAIGLVASALAAPARPLNANYYVAPKGGDDQPGTIDRPFATLQRAIDAVQPGQLIYIRGGTYTPAAVTTFKKSGHANAFIELRPYPGELPVIDGAKVPGSEPTWRFVKAANWRIRGPLHLTNGRGAGVYIDRDCQSLELELIESSYNGKTAERGGHGFYILGDNVRDIMFKNCDAHHNANHRTKAGENADANIYQHGDGFRRPGAPHRDPEGHRRGTEGDRGAESDRAWRHARLGHRPRARVPGRGLDVALRNAAARYPNGCAGP